jgi:diaminohydroxyphosphoribosylaminopyrimidine deaminase/5-amino-6-(5-phosphoribosylamino)uracil reductase
VRLPEDERFMARALRLAARGLGRTNPNPLVGCVIVRDQRIVGEGFHARAGAPHAEAIALAQAGRAASGATLYVNLEPCAHVGRTPPCAPVVISAGIHRVVAALGDPNPLVSGKGFSSLARAGILVERGVRAAEARLLNRTFLEAAPMPRPFVLLKVALTLDGRIATRGRHSRWVTSPLQRRAARRLRGFHDAVAVGIGTVLDDDPLLLASPRPRRRFDRIVFDTSLRIPETSRLVKTARRHPLTVVCAGGRRKRLLEARGVRVLEVPRKAGRVSLPAALKALRGEGIWSLMVEGGSELLGAFLDARILDEVALFRAPLLVGGRKSLPAFGGEGALRMERALRLRPEGLASRFPGAGFSEGLFELYRP